MMGVLFFNGTGAPKNESESLAWFHKAASDNAGAIKTLANCYCAAGRAQEAIDTLRKFSTDHPRDHDASLTLAGWQLWFGKESGYEATRRRIMKSATGTDDAAVAQAAAKAWCLRPSSDPVLLSNALDFARFGVGLRKNTPWLPWYQLSLGMAQYRNGKYSDAEQTLVAAEQAAGNYQDLLPTARFFRTMCLFQEGQPTGARELFNQAQTEMTPLPQDPNVPVVDGKTASHDVIISWLAYQEAKSLLNHAGD
jgi:tetratricopeptide (TPR) repeat protein